MDNIEKKIPFGYPQGTGVRLVRTDSTGSDVRELALLLSSYGCYPRTAVKAAICIIENGFYEARLNTTISMCLNLRRDLTESGVMMEIETHIPEGNYDHARDSNNRNREVRINRYPLEELEPMFNEALEKANMLHLVAKEEIPVMKF